VDSLTQNDGMTEPLISVCIPVYNGETMITRALDSVLEARKRVPGNVEVCVVDDVSKDGSMARLMSYSGVPGMRISRNEKNLGLIGNWQYTLSLGRGAIVTLLHMDDWYAPEALEIVTEKFSSNARLALLALGQTFHDEKRNSIPYTQRWLGTYTGREYLDFQLQLKENPAPSSVFFRRSLVEPLHTYYDPAYRWCPELDLYIRLALANLDGDFCHLDKFLVHRGSHSDQFSMRYPALVSLDICTLISRYRTVAASPETRERWRRAARQKIADGIAAAMFKHDFAHAADSVSRTPFVRWAAEDPMGALWILGNLTWRGLRLRVRSRRQNVTASTEA